ncbi:MULTISPECIES: acyl-CoA carboxylase subunit epsilon [Arthrobacter]|uniref:Acyl-CoA carboxylase subunit epsilon n=2 Tax=Arthrobacter TaxID=1663 RepID=A0ABU9KN96_9MICC|nr:acyl-CoA carboxylase subunit epsilon [Arthrobacter sp. YJM1]MDP5228340.1 acyl-CoA carboxylase subunit epsilon [Arthrobacter sp. YJM1]
MDTTPSENTTTAHDDAAQPLLTVTKGNPTAEELAALTAVVGALAAAPQAAEEQPRHSERFWRRRAAFNVPLKAGPGSWKRSQG